MALPIAQPRTYLGLLSDDALGELANVLIAPGEFTGICNIASDGRKRDGFFDLTSILARTKGYRFTTLSLWPIVPYIDRGGVREEMQVDFYINSVIRDPALLLDKRFDQVYRLEMTLANIPSERAEPIRASIDTIIELRGHQLTELAFMRSTDLAFVYSGHVARWAMSCPNLKSFEHSSPNMELLYPLWGRVGSTLEKVHLHCWDTEHWPVTLSLIEHYCRNLKDITLLDPTDNNAVPVYKFATFIAGYGRQLERLSLYHVEADGRTFFVKLDPETYSYILASCPKVRVSYFEEGYDFESVLALGNRLEKLSFDFPRASNWFSLERAMNHCNTLQSLRVFELRDGNPLDCEAWKSLLAGQLRSLESIALPTVAQPAQVIKSISERTGHLMSIEFTCTGLSNGSMFTCLVQTNPSLMKVHVAETKIPPDRVTDDDTLTLVSGVLTVFWRCRKLKKFRIGLLSEMPSEESMRNLFVPFRSRGIELQSDFGNEDVCVFLNSRTGGMSIFDNVGLTAPEFELRV